MELGDATGDALEHKYVSVQVRSKSKKPNTKQQQQKQAIPSGSSLEKTNKIIPDLVIRASHLSGSNGVDCDLDGANHIVDFKTLQGLSHYDNTSTIPGATLEKRQKAVNKEYHDRTRKLDSELHGSQQDQRGPIESELNEYGHRGRVLAPVIGRYGGASSDSASFWTLPLGKWLANTRLFVSPPRGGTGFSN